MGNPASNFDFILKLFAMKKTLSLIALLIYAFLGQSQTNSQAFDWAINPGSSQNTLLGLKYDSQGNLLVLADMRDSASFDGNIVVASPVSSYPGNNQYLGKRGSNGVSSILIQRGNQSGTYLTSFKFLNVDQNDNIYIGGTNANSSYSFGNGVTINEKGYFIVKYNNAGVAQWAKVYNFNNPAMTAFVQDNMRFSILSDGTVLLIITELNRMNFLRLSSTGTELTNTVTAIQSSAASLMTSSKNNFCADQHGNFYIYSNAINNNQIILGTDTNKVVNGSHPAYGFLWKLNKHGVIAYKKSWRGTIQDLAVDPTSGNLLFSWIQYGAQNNLAPMDQISGNSGTFTESFEGIIALDSLGNFLNKSIDGVANATNFMDLTSIIPLGDLKLIGTREYNPGYTLNAGSQTLTSSNSVFTWFELDNSLQPIYFVAHPEYTTNSILPELFIANHNSKVAVSVSWLATEQTTLNVNGQILTANDKNTAFPSNYNPPFNTFGSDIVIAQFDRSLQGGTNGLTDIQSNLNIVVYPNPSNGIIHVNSSSKMDRIYAYSSDGRLIKTISPLVYETDMILEYPGLYFLKIVDEKGNFSTKIVIIE